MALPFLLQPHNALVRESQVNKSNSTDAVGVRAADPGENNLEELSIAFCGEEKRVGEKH